MRRPTSNAKKIENLAKIVEGLSQGHYFNITRLTTLKNLCRDSEAADNFVYYLAQRTFENMIRSEPTYIDAEKWQQYKIVVNEALESMARYLQEKTPDIKNTLQHLLSRLKQLQNTQKHQQWGTVRIIESSEAFVVEQALECLLSPQNSSYWGYHVGRAYAERYNPRYGTGLIPESVPMMQDILTFWYHYSVMDEGSANDLLAGRYATSMPENYAQCWQIDEPGNHEDS